MVLAAVENIVFQPITDRVLPQVQGVKGVKGYHAFSSHSKVAFTLREMSVKGHICR